MSKHKHTDLICIIIFIMMILTTLLFINGRFLGVVPAASIMGFENRLFDASRVHTLNIVMDDWDSFIESCTNEEYVQCSVIIDNESYKNVAIRAKGNTSLSQVKNFDSSRYSFKIEFDHYDSQKTYHGLDKLSLNNIIQDNTYMKDFLTYKMMNDLGADAPLCSYVQISVNGEEWGLYLAVEGIEDSFLERNYGSDYGNLYKPDSMDMGGGKGNGRNFDMDGQQDDNHQIQPDMNGQADKMMSPNADGDQNKMMSPNADGDQNNMMPPDMDGDQNKMMPPDMDGDQNNMMPPDMDEDQNNMKDGQMNMGGHGGSQDVSLIYSDDDPESYSNIFDNAKTDINEADKKRLIAALKKLNNNEDIEETVNVENVIRYFVVHNFVCNFDSYTGSMIHNYYLYEKDGQLSMIPWDYNLAFGGFIGGSDATSLVNYPIDSPVFEGTLDSRPMLNWIFESEEYTEMYHDIFDTFVSDYFESGYFTEMITEVKTMIAPYVESDPTKFCTYEEFDKGADTLREFCLLRAESIRAQLDGTIASTSEEQSSDTLVDASSIDISLMGNMGNKGNIGNMGNMENPEKGMGRRDGRKNQSPK